MPSFRLSRRGGSKEKAKKDQDAPPAPAAAPSAVSAPSEGHGQQSVPPAATPPARPDESPSARRDRLKQERRQARIAERERVKQERQRAIDERKRAREEKKRAAKEQRLTRRRGPGTAAQPAQQQPPPPAPTPAVLPPPAERTARPAQEAPTVAGDVPSSGEERSIQEAAEREALARLVDAERRAGAVTEPDEARIQGETERRISEAAERVESEATVEQPEAPGTAPGQAQPASPAPPVRETPGLEPRRAHEQELAREIEDTEARLAAAQQRTAEALDRATSRLKEVEARASEAEARAEHAEEFAKLKKEEAERESRLRELLDRIAQAEQRAAEAEQRARETVDRIADLAPESGLTSPATSESQSEQRASTESEPNPTPETIAPESQAPEPQAEEQPTFSEFQPPAAEAPPAPAPEPDASESTQPAWIPHSTELEPEPESSGEEGSPVIEGAPLNLNEATYEDLRRLRLSVTQAGRVLAYRDRVGGFKSLDQLDNIPGFPKSYLTELKRGLTL